MQSTWTYRRGIWAQSRSNHLDNNPPVNFWSRPTTQRRKRSQRCFVATGNPPSLTSKLPAEFFVAVFEMNFKCSKPVILKQKPLHQNATWVKQASENPGQAKVNGKHCLSKNGHQNKNGHRRWKSCVTNVKVPLCPLPESQIVSLGLVNGASNIIQSHPPGPAMADFRKSISSEKKTKPHIFPGDWVFAMSLFSSTINVLRLPGMLFSYCELKGWTLLPPRAEVASISCAVYNTWPKQVHDDRSMVKEKELSQSQKVKWSLAANHVSNDPGPLIMHCCSVLKLQWHWPMEGLPIRAQKLMWCHLDC